MPTDSTISALNVPHCSIVFDLYQVTEIRAELLGDAGIATETIKHANIVSFTCLKAFAFDQRFERKDAHDLTYCIEHAPDGLDSVAAVFREALAGKHGPVVRESLSILRRRFAGEDRLEGFRKDGPVAVARFEHSDVSLSLDQGEKTLNNITGLPLPQKSSLAQLRFATLGLVSAGIGSI